jgi:hypothetical protein
MNAAELKSLAEASDSLRKIANDTPKGAARDVLKSYASHLQRLVMTGLRSAA